MKILPISDLHIEHGFDVQKFVDILADADVLVIAGDMTTVTSLEQFLAEVAPFMKKYKNIVYVPGNHEYYGADPVSVHSVLLEAEKELNAAGKRFHYLRPGIEVTIDGQRFLGGTMWFKSSQHDWLGPKIMNDFRLIKNLVPWVFEQNKFFTEELEKNLLPSDIVVAHHLPSIQSVPGMYKGEISNAFYVCEQAGLILEKQPKIWIHGHTHTQLAYDIYKTRIICNPKGYPHEMKRDFNPSLIIEV